VTIDRLVWTILNEALAVYRDSPRASHWLRMHLARFEEPVRIAVAGLPGSGKSTVVNALIGEQLAPIDGFAWYRDGASPRAQVFAPHGPPQEVPIVKRDGRPRVELGAWRGQQVDRVVVDWPTRTLRDAILIDTPATATPEQVFGEADAVLYLMRHMHSADLRLLQTAHDHAIARTAAVNTVVVLSRADEIGAGRIDALSSAKQIARRYRRDVHVQPLCQNVVAVAGLLAIAGRTLHEKEFAALGALAALPRADLEDHLLSADRFVGPDFPVALGADVRQGLVERFGIFGVRLTTTLIRQGFNTQVKLTGQLLQRSGLSELRDAMGLYFTERREVLKARSALLALDVVLRMEARPAARKLVTDLERALASAHEFRELRLVAALQSGRTKLPGDLDAEALRLVGGQGTNPLARLGMEYEPDESELREAIFDALDRWQEHAENPVLDNAQRQAASVVVRSCEGMLAALP
jgi:hypothetical protein